jgi:hypothetical protein
MAAGVVLTLFVLWASSIWSLVRSPSLYWKAVSVSWLASCGVIVYIISSPPSGLEALLIAPFAFALIGCSLFLTPMQLVFGGFANRRAFSTATVLYDPMLTSLPDPPHITAE